MKSCSLGLVSSVRCAAVVAAVVFSIWEVSAKTVSLPVGGDLVEAVAQAEPGDVIQLAEGTYSPTNAISISKALTIVGAGRAKTIVDGTSSAGKAFVITSADVKLQALTICNYTKGNGTAYDLAKGGFINMSGGTLEDLVISNNCSAAGNMYGIAVTMRGAGLITNCLIRANKQTNGGGGGYGGGVYMTAGTVVDCKILDNTMSHYGDCGGGVYAKGGTVKNCLVRGNGANSGSYSDVHGTGGCGIYVNGVATVDCCMVVSNFMNGVYITGGGTMKNSVVTGQKTNSSSSSWPAGVYIKNGSMYNCTVYDNVSSATGSGVQMEKGAAINNIIYNNGKTANASVASGCTFNTNIVNILPDVGIGNLVTNPLLKSPETLDFSLTAASGAINAGATLADVTVDYAGLSRPQGVAYDIGAYEYELKPGQYICAIEVLEYDWPSGRPVVATAKVVGAPDGASIAYEWRLDGVLVDQSERTAVFENVGSGKHTITMTATVDGTTQSPVVKEDAFKVIPTKVYVDANGDNTPPYETSGHAAHSLADALAQVWLADGATSIVHIAAGIYPIAQTITLAKPCRIIGAGREQTVINGANCSGKAFVISDKDVCIEKLTICNFSSGITGNDKEKGGYISLTAGTLSDLIVSNNNYSGSNMYGLSVSMRGAGLITNCLFQANKQTNGGGSGYGNVYMTAGTVIDCRFIDNTMSHYGDVGGGVYATGGKIMNCYFRGNGCTDCSYYGPEGTGGCGLYLNGPAVADRCWVISNSCNGVVLIGGSTLMNSVVTGHRKSDWPAGVHINNGNMYNCTVYGNVSSVSGSGVQIKAGTAINNIIYGNGSIANVTVTSGCTFHHNIVNVLPDVGSNNLAVDPGLTSPATLDFTLTDDSVALEAGAELADVTTDIVGVERPQIEAYDIGAYEKVLPPGTVICSISSSQANWPAGSSPQVTAKVVGAPAGAVLAYQWNLDGVAVAGATERTVAFADVGCGSHTVKLELTMDGVRQPDVEKKNLFKVCPTEVYVDRDGDNQPPYDTAKTAAHSLDDALSELWLSAGVTGVIHIAAGDYPVTKQILLESPCRILGAGRDVTRIEASGAPGNLPGISMTKECVVRDLTYHGKKSSCSGAGIYMKDGLLDGLCLSNVTMSTGANGIVVYMEKGTVTNCVFAKNTLATTGGTGSGGGVYMTDGLVVDCDFSEHRSGRYGYLGGGVCLTGGTARRCTVRSSGCTNWNYGNEGSCGGSAFYLNGANAVVEDCTCVSNLTCAVYLKNGTLRNTLVVGNGYDALTGAGNTVNAASGVYVCGGKLYNCTVADNTNRYTAAISDIRVGSGTAKNNIGLLARVDGGTVANNCFNEAVAFKDAAALDFHLTSRAANCINMGDLLDYTASSVDLDGNPRIHNFGFKSSAPDCGCYESVYGTPGLMLIVR